MTEQSCCLCKLNPAHNEHRAKTRQEIAPQKGEPKIYNWSLPFVFELEDVQDLFAAFSDLSCVMLSLSMFSSLLYSEDKFSWLPVVLLRQRFLLCLNEQHHIGGNER